MKSVKSVITGGAGFIGSNLVDRLVNIGHKVIVLDNFVSGKKSNLSHHSKKDVKIVKIDITDQNLEKYFKKADYIFHLAALAQIIPSFKNPNKYLNVSKYDKSNIARSICDYIAGMTDRYAINLYNKIK